MSGDDFGALWRERLSSGSKLAAKALGTALRDDPSRLPFIAPLTRDARATVRVAALRALEEVAGSRPELVAPYAADLVAGLAAPEPDAQVASLAALTHVGPFAAAEAALALPFIAELLKARRPALREEAARCLGHLGARIPERAPAVAERLADALEEARNPRAGSQARELLAALEGVVPHLPPPSRAKVAGAVAPLRGHPNLQVRERAGRLAKQLG